MKINKFFRKLAWTVFIVVVILGVATSASASTRVTTDSFPIVRNGNFAALYFGPNRGVTVGSGNIGVDIGFWSTSHPDVYSPCAVHKDDAGTYNDPYYGACFLPQGSNSYYKYLSYSPSSNNFPYGIFIDQTNNGIIHSWGNRANYAALEVYPSDNETGTDNDGYNTLTNKYGGVRLQLQAASPNTNLFPINANGGYYTNNLGTINSLPIRSSSALLNGYVVNSPNGTSPEDGSVVVAFFQQPGWRGATYGYTTTGYPYYSYAAPLNHGTNGYYNSGPLYPGCYIIAVQQYDKPLFGGNNPKLLREVKVYAEITQPNLRVDFTLNQPYFGYQNLSACHQPISDTSY